MNKFRILLVEDILDTLRQLSSLLREALPDSQVDEAESIEEGKRLIDKAVAGGEPYDLAILDFKLPVKTGGHDEVDESLCRDLGDRMPTAIVSHITGFAGDPRVIAHISREHTGRTLGFFLDKRKGFAKELIKKSRQALYGARLERQIHDLFLIDRWPHPDGSGARSTSPRPAGSVTNRLMGLCLDIAEVWRELSPMTQSLVKRHFAVEEKADGVSVVKK